MAIVFSPLISIGLTQLVGITPIAPLITYSICIVSFIYIYHTLVMTGIFFKLGVRWRRKPLLSQTFAYVARSSFLWMLFLPISRIIGDLVKWYVTGEYVELVKGGYHLYIIMLMIVGLGAGAFFSLAYLSIIKGKLR